jgi:hypothetical protein
MTALILAILQQAVVPEAMAYIRARWTRTGQLPTDQEVIAALNLKVEDLVAIGEAWLAAHPPVPLVP